MNTFYRRSLGIPTTRLVALAAAVVLSGCSRTADGPAANRNLFEYMVWEGKVARELKPDEQAIFQEAETEIRLHEMATGAKGSDAVNAAYLTTVDGLSAWQIMDLGLKDRLARLKIDHADAEDKYGYNSKIRTMAGDTESAKFLGARVEEDRKRLEKTSADLAQTEAELKLIAERSRH